eukprot:3620611-Amphidinium_carterae.1
MATLSVVRVARPRAGVFENVEGIRVKDSDSDRSPLEWVQSELKSMNYHSRDISIDLAIFHGVVRRRRALLGFEQREARTAASH